jgi:serine/threonine-protein kinase RsbW
MKNFPASLDYLHEMIQFVKEYTKMAGFKSDQITKIELAVEEALVNIISYGYKDYQGIIFIHCEVSSSSITIEIKDQGIPYNPLNKKKSEQPPSNKRKEIGGYGVFFIQNVMDQVDYRRENDFNILTLTKKIS